MIPIRLFLASAACLALLACSHGPDRLDTLVNTSPCPQATVLGDASRVVNVDGDPVIGNVGFTGEILGVRSYCKYKEDEPIVANLEIDFAFGKGQAASAGRHDYSYFVSVTRRDSAVINKKDFTVSADFGDGDIAYDQAKIARIVIPRADESVSGTNFEIVVGFALTPEQLAFNRSGVRFRAQAGAAAQGAPGT